MKQKRQYYRGPMPVSIMVPTVIKPALKEKGYYLGTLMLEWPQIIGIDLAAQCRPRRLQFKRGEQGKGKLHLSATSGFAMELGYYTLILREKINSYIGFALVDQITMDAKLFIKTPIMPKQQSWFEPSKNLDEALTRLKGCIKTGA